MKHSRIYTCILLLRQSRFAEIHHLAAQVLAHEPDFHAIQYLAYQSYLSRSDFTSAEELYRQMILHLKEDDPLLVSFNLRHAYMRILTFQQGDLDVAIDYFIEIEKAKYCSGYHVALACGLHARAIMLGISHGLRSAKEKHQAITLLRKSADRYLEEGYDAEYCREIIFLSTQYRQLPFVNSLAAKKCLDDLLNIGVEKQDSLMQAEARLGLLEIAVDDAFAAKNPRENFKPVIRSVGEIAALFNEGGHLLNGALAQHAFGVAVMKYGVEIGIDYLAQAINEFLANDFFVEAQSLYRAIATWHLEHGNDLENREAEEMAAQLNSEIPGNQSMMLSYLALIERAYREGRIDQGRLLFQEAEEGFRHHPLYSQLLSLLASSLRKIGLVDEGVGILRKVLEMALPLEVSSFLSNAYTNLAGSLSEEQYQEAESLINAAIAIDLELSDYIAAVQHEQLRVQILLTKQQKEGREFSFISAEIDFSLNKSEQLLQGDWSLKAETARGQMMQAVARSYYLRGDFIKAAEIYSDAERIFSRYQLNSNLAFLYTHMALVLFQLARNESSIERYDQVKDKLQFALEYFERSGLLEEQARALGLTALSRQESGRLEKNIVVAQERWLEAEQYFERSYQINRFLRNHTDSADALSVQRSMIAFIKDSQTYTEQAFYMHLLNTRDTVLSIKWLERMKGQALLSALEKNNALNHSINAGQQSNLDLLDEQDRFTDVSSAILPYIPDNVLIAQYFYSADELFIFGIRKQWERPQFIRLPFNRDALDELLRMHFSPPYGSVRKMLDHGLEDQWQLFNHIITPLEDWCEVGEQICLIPYGRLHQLPLHTLKTSSGQYLIERNGVFYNQTLSVWLHLLERENKPASSPSSKHFVFGNSRNNLPYAQREALTIADILKSSVFLQDEVTKAKVLESLAHADILHLAGHGVLSGEQGWENGMLMAHEEVLTAMDVLSCKTEASLVVLSGCDTGLGKYHKGDELTGLVRSFLHAGSSGMIVSLWKVNDAATTELFEHFYSLLNAESGLSKVLALQQAMCREIAKGKNFFYWGAFQLIGNLG